MTEIAQTVRKHFGPHNAQAVMQSLMSVAMAAGEAAQGILRNSHHQHLASGNGLVAAQGDPAHAARAADQFRFQHGEEAKLALRQIQLGLQSLQQGYAELQAALSMQPGTPKQSTAAADLAESAGSTSKGPKLALA